MSKVVFFDIGDTLVSRRKWVPGAKQAISELRNKEIRLGIISNTGRLSREDLEKLLPEDFDFGWFSEELVMLSSEVGIEKPSLSIFLLAAQHANASPWDVVFVGESLSETMAAQQAGLQAARIVTPEKDYPELVKVVLRQAGK